MSLVSASGFIGGIKEYTYRGIQQLPIVLAATSLVFTVATGSIAHMNLAAGLSVITPAYTKLAQLLIAYAMQQIAPLSITWKRSTGDTCNIVPSHDQKAYSLEYFKADKLGSLEPVPSYWFMSIAFFIGYSISNAVDSLMTPSTPNSDSAHIEKRNTQSIFIIIAISVFFAMVLGMRFVYMRGCEGRGTLGIVLSCISAMGAGLIGYGMYSWSRTCGARSSDLFGVLSQMLPATANTVNPIVCSAN
jgi:hypothetical protein